MKKTAIIACLAMLALQSHVLAQYSRFYYHCQGDTVEQDSPIYFHQWWAWDSITAARGDVYVAPHTYNSSSSTVLVRHFSPDTLKIIGIAGMRNLNWNQNQGPDTTVDINLYLYSASPFTQLAEINRKWWRDKHRMLHLVYNGTIPNRPWDDPDDFDPLFNESCCYNHMLDLYYGLYEYYFDTAFYVVDSFYVGSNYAYDIHIASSLFRHYGKDCENRSCTFPMLWYKLNHSYNSGIWHHAYQNAAWLIWPIIEIDTTVPPDFACLPLEDLHVSNIDTFSVSIEWNDVSAQTTSLMVEYKPNDDSVTLWSTLFVHDTNAATISLPDTHYSDYILRIRAVCDSIKRKSPWSDTLFVSLPRHVCLPLQDVLVSHIDTFSVTIEWNNASPHTTSLTVEYKPDDDNVTQWSAISVSGSSPAVIPLPDTLYTDYILRLRADCDSVQQQSPWSNTLFVSLPRDTSSAGIGSPLAGPYVAILPNPASGLTTVKASCSLRQVDLYHSDGTHVYSSPAAGNTHTLPLDGLAAGTYIASVRTDCGTAARRLVVR